MSNQSHDAPDSARPRSEPVGDLYVARRLRGNSLVRPRSAERFRPELSDNFSLLAKKTCLLDFLSALKLVGILFGEKKHSRRANEEEMR